MKRKPVYSTHIGAASILLIFLVLSLISFAALTMVNSRADYILSKKMYDRSVAYYAACHEANGFIAENDPEFSDIWQDLNSNEVITKSIPLSEFQTLDVGIKPSGKKRADSLSFEITEWRVVTHAENIELDETLPVLKKE